MPRAEARGKATNSAGGGNAARRLSAGLVVVSCHSLVLRRNAVFALERNDFWSGHHQHAFRINRRACAALAVFAAFSPPFGVGTRTSAARNIRQKRCHISQDSAGKRLAHILAPLGSVRTAGISATPRRASDRRAQPSHSVDPSWCPGHGLMGLSVIARLQLQRQRGRWRVGC